MTLRHGWSVCMAVVVGLSICAQGPALAQEYRSLETDHFVVQYSPTQEKLARNAAEVAELAFQRISDFLGLQPRGRILLLMAPDREAFRRASGGRIPDWGVGLAIPSQAQILITSPADSPALIDLEEIITHEVAHVLLGAALPGQPLPRWFDEGHAMYHARQWRIAEGTRIVWALLARTLIPLAELEHAFPYNRASAELAYTESYTAVEFLVKTGGPEGFRALVRNAARGGDFEAALIEIYGWNLTRFEEAWREHLRARYRWAALPRLVFTIPGIFTLLFLAAYLRKRQRARRKLAVWQEEDRRFGGSL